jgi:hypothetical protein
MTLGIEGLGERRQRVVAKQPRRLTRTPASAALANGIDARGECAYERRVETMFFWFLPCCAARKMGATQDTLKIRMFRFA